MNVFPSLPARARRWRASLSTAAALVAGNYGQVLNSEIDEALANEIRAAQLRPLRNGAPLAAFVNLGNACVLEATLWNSPQRTRALLWGLGLLVSLAVSVAPALLRGRRRVPGKFRGSLKSVGRATIFAALVGSCWGAVPLLFFAEAGENARVVLVFLCSGMVCGGAFILASLPIAALAMVVPIVAGSLVALSQDVGNPAAPILLLAFYVTFIGCLVLERASELIFRQFSSLELERLASRDILTNLPNTAGFRTEVKRAAARMANAGERYSVMVVDINNLKKTNERLGYASGDMLIQEVAKRLRVAARRSDLVARLDAGKFAVLIAGLDGSATIPAYAKRLMGVFDDAFDLPGGKAFATCCVGVAVAGGEGEAAGDQLRNAALALHVAQANGRGVVHFYSPQDEVSRSARDALEADLRAALRARDLRIHFQPFLDIATNQIAGFEALLRWKHPVRGQVSPVEVISIAEERGLIDMVGAYVLAEACQAAAAWPENLRVAVNVSPLQLRARTLATMVATALRESGLPARRLEIEVTENAVIAEHDLAEHILRSLRDMGVQIALDDFGVGFSSLNYLWSLPFQRIKIDKSFIDQIPTNQKALAIVRGILNLARDLGLSVTVEGVETVEQLMEMRRHSHVEAQGYLIGKAMPQSEVAGFLESWLGRAAA